MLILGEKMKWRNESEKHVMKREHFKHKFRTNKNNFNKEK